MYNCLLFLLAADLPAQPSKREERPNDNLCVRAKVTQTVKVGLLIHKQGPSADAEPAARQGAEMAVAEANKNGGFGGRPFELIVRSVDGPWGAGSKAIVNLAFEENAWAILASLDGRSTHLAEQIVVKGRVALVSAWATEATLTQINVPWFFRCLPDDRHQAKALVQEIFEVRRLKRVATATAGTYDARMAASAFSQTAAAAGYPLTLQLSYGAADRNRQDTLDAIEHDDIEGVVLFGPPSETADLVCQMRDRGMKQALFGSLSLTNDDFFTSAGPALEGATFVASGHWRTFAGQDFQQKYQKLYGRLPSARAAYAYDGMALIIEALQTAGLNRDKIRDALANIDYPHGVTGPIRFDARGNRIGPVHLMQTTNGHPSLLHGAPSNGPTF